MPGSSGREVGARVLSWVVMSQLHIHADPGDVAPYVLLPGDPKRATFIAETFLEEPRLYSDNRLLLGYTGRYKGMPVSVQTTGMGCPSLAIVVEELVRLGAQTLVRVGTSGIVSRAVQPTDLIVASASVPMDGTTRQYLRGAPYAPTAAFEVTRALVEAGEEAGETPHVGLIQTEDAFYATAPEDVPALAERGVLAIEMEAAALFLLAELRGVRAGCALVASNRIGDSSFIDPARMRDAVKRMVQLSLEAGLRLRDAA